MVAVIMQEVLVGVVMQEVLVGVVMQEVLVGVVCRASKFKILKSVLGLRSIFVVVLINLFTMENRLMMRSAFLLRTWNALQQSDL